MPMRRKLSSCKPWPISVVICKQWKARKKPSSSACNSTSCPTSTNPLPNKKNHAVSAVFDDLLLDVHQALTTNEHGNALAKAAAANWEIALIDEFQDTDPLQ